MQRLDEIIAQALEDSRPEQTIVSKRDLLDHLVGTGEEGGRNG